MAVTINIPSQVKTYANLAAFPASGSLKTIYIAEDTNKTYRWTGSVYVEISASAAMTWGQIGGTLSNQTDLQNALDAKVPTSRTLTINGVTQDLSANRTFTISTGITIGSTAIASGVVGRVLFEGVGNVVQESSSLFWDATNNRLGIGTSTPSSPLHVIGSATSGFDAIRFKGQYSETGYLATSNGAVYFASGAGVTGSFLELSSAVANLRGGTTAVTFTVGSERMRVNNAGNVLIGTTTDAGFRLDVNGTARVQGNAQFGTGFYWDNTNNRLGVGTSTPLRAVDVFASSPEIATRISGNGTGKFSFLGNAGGEVGAISLTGSSGEMRIFTSSSYFPTFYSSGSEAMRIATTRNILINTTTDAGFRLDVNGTARVQGPSGYSMTYDANGIFNLYGTYSRLDLFNSAGSLRARLNNDGPNGTLTLYQNATSYIFLNGAQSGNNSYIATALSIGNQSAANASSILELTSTTKGFLPPRLTTTQKNAIASPAAGLMVYDTTLNVISYYNGSMWI